MALGVQRRVVNLCGTIFIQNHLMKISYILVGVFVPSEVFSVYDYSCCCSVAKSCSILCEPMDCSIQASLSFTISCSLLQLMSIELAIQSSHHLSLPSPLALILSQHQNFFQWVSSSHHRVKVLEIHLQHQSFQWIFRTDFL